MVDMKIYYFRKKIHLKHLYAKHLDSKTDRQMSKFDNYTARQLDSQTDGQMDSKKRQRKILRKSYIQLANSMQTA